MKRNTKRCLGHHVKSAVELAGYLIFADTKIP